MEISGQNFTPLQDTQKTDSMEHQLIEDLLNCDSNKQVSEVIAGYKDFLKQNPGSWNHVFRTRKRINIIAKEKTESFKDLLN
jgi:hypothetical protein